jgi:hypothetical protein
MSGGIIIIESKIVFTNSVLFPGRPFVFGIEDGNYNYIIMCDNGSKLELFRRGETPNGWDVDGNEVQ